MAKYYVSFSLELAKATAVYAVDEQSEEQKSLFLFPDAKSNTAQIAYLDLSAIASHTPSGDTAIAVIPSHPSMPGIDLKLFLYCMFWMTTL